MFGAAASNAHNPNNDMEVPNAATDGISCVEWSPTANYLVAGSWDNQIRCWEVMSNGSTTPKASISHSAPILCASWSSDGARVYTGSCDKTAKVWDLATNQSMQAAPLSSMRAAALTSMRAFDVRGGKNESERRSWISATV
uniref:Peroxin-7 n=1 Tax=Chrysotila carterae TaxID=13221 RepID=A0A7S4BLL1_CHRCT